MKIIQNEISSKLNNLSAFFLIIFSSIIFTGCASMIPASAEAVETTRHTLAALAEQTAPGSAVAVIARQQASEDSGIIPRTATEGGMELIFTALGGIIPGLGLAARFAWKASQTKKLAKEVADMQPDEANKHLVSKI